MEIRRLINRLLHSSPWKRQQSFGLSKVATDVVRNNWDSTYTLKAELTELAHRLNMGYEGKKGDKDHTQV